MRRLLADHRACGAQLDDGTGVVEAKEWKQQDEPEYVVQQRQLRRENTYVRVVGQLRLNKDRRYVAVHHMRLVEDANEITYHYLEAIQAHLYYTRGGATRAAAAAAAATTTTTTMGVQAPFAAGAAGGYRPMGAPPAHAHAMTGNPMPTGLPPGLNVNQGRVLTVIKQDGGDVGVHVEAVARKLGLSLGEVRKTVDFLSEEGHIFNTTDEHHYRTTDT
jgi:replication factor A2